MNGLLTEDYYEIPDEVWDFVDAFDFLIYSLREECSTK